MNTDDLDILKYICKMEKVNQRMIAKLSGYSLGKVNQSITKLINGGYLEENYRLTEAGLKKVEACKPQRAIILAAGFGLRMAPMNKEIPKAFIEINKEALIERIICQLKEIGIHEIYIVVGFMKEQFDYLIDKYNIKLIVNEQYYVKNNLYSLAKVIEKIDNCYIVPCDIWCRENPFSNIELYSWYMMCKEDDEDSSLRVNRKREVVRVSSGEYGHKMVGIAYVLQKEADIIRKNVQKMILNRKYDNSFWEDAAMYENQMIFMAKLIGAKEVFEINTYEQLRALDASSEQLKSDILGLLARILNVEENDIENIQILKKGMTNRSFLFSCKQKKYIMRIPGEGTEQLINRVQEHAVYTKINDIGICDRIYYINPQNGYKLSEFIENARVCDPTNKQDIEMCMKKLRNFHELNIQVNHEFDLFKQLEFYESLRKGIPSLYRDYNATKKKIYELKSYIEAQPKAWSLTHIDAVPDNFMFSNDKIYLIDWEYAGMQDPHVDIAMFCIYSLYEREQVDFLIDAYFSGKCDDSVRIKIYCYISICGLLWSNWCEYKKSLGVEFGEYSLRQYRYAKDYYYIVKEMLQNNRIGG